MAHKKICIYGKNDGKVKIIKADSKKGTLFGIIASEIRTHVYKVTTGCIYCKGMAIN